MINKADEGEKDCLSSRGFDDGGFAHPGGVEIDVGAFFCCFLLDVEVKEFDYIADEVW